MCRALEPFQIGQDVGFARGIQSGKRFIHQQHIRARQQRPPDGDPLLFPARQAVRAARQQGGKAQKCDHIIARDVIGRRAAARKPRPVIEVLSNTHMRKKPRVLKDIAQAALMHGHKAAGVLQNAPVQADITLIRAEQTCHCIDHAGFSGTRAAKKGGDARGSGKADIQRHCAKIMADIDLEAHVGCCPMRAAMRRDRISDVMTAATATAQAIRVNVVARASAPGI